MELFCTHPQQAAKNAASAATQMINAAGGAGKSNRNQSSQQQLLSHSKLVADDVIPRIVLGLRATKQYPDNPNAQKLLVDASLEMIQVCASFYWC